MNVHTHNVYMSIGTTTKFPIPRYLSSKSMKGRKLDIILFLIPSNANFSLTTGKYQPYSWKWTCSHRHHHHSLKHSPDPIRTIPYLWWSEVRRWESDVVWCYMKWCGVVWCGVKWSEVKWNEVRISKLFFLHSAAQSPQRHHLLFCSPAPSI